MKSLRLIGVFLALISTSGWAQESSGMDWKITPYLWMVGISGDVAIGPIEQELDVSFSDVWNDFEIGGAVFAEFGKDKHAVHLDYTYLRLRPDPTPLPSPPSSSPCRART